MMSNVMKANPVDPVFFISERVRRWQAGGITGDPARLLQFVLDQTELSDEGRRRLAAALIAEDFRSLRREGRQIWIGRMLDCYLPEFDGRGFPLDRRRLLEQLIQADLETTQHPIRREKMIGDYPEMADFIDACFAQKQYLFSRFRRLDEKITALTGDRLRDGKTEITLTERYQVESHLGSGGQKDVYRVVQWSTGQTLALKELRSRYRDHPLFRLQMESEAVLQSRLTHPNIPPVFSLQGKGTEAPIFVERLIPGTSWLSVIESLTAEENASLLLTVSRTVAFAHERHRIIHGDLKPENVMLGEQNGRYNEVYIVDWGLAVSLDDPKLDEKIPCGTISYMPPESLASSGPRVSAATDVFMLGGILYRILTGRAPYEDTYYSRGGIGSLAAVAAAKISPVPLLNERTGRENPPELIEIAEKALRKNPEDRYADAGAFADALEGYRRRAGLGDRLRKAAETFGNLTGFVGTAAENSASETKTSELKTAAVSMMDLVMVVNEFRLIREELESTDRDQSETETSSALFRRTVESERQARYRLLDCALKTRDYGLAAAQLLPAEELDSRFPAAKGTAAAPLLLFRSRLERGLAARRRERVTKWAAALCAALLVALMIWGVYQKRQMADQQRLNALIIRENDLLQRIPLEKDSLVAQKEHFGQGILAVCDKIPNETPSKWGQIDGVSKLSLLQEKQSPFREIINALCFSGDERFFAFLTPEIIGIGEFPGAEGRKAGIRPSDSEGNGPVIQYQNGVGDGIGGDAHLLANPCFCREDSKNPAESARFVLIRPNGAFSFLTSNGSEPPVWRNLHGDHERSLGEKLNLGSPVLTGGDGKSGRLIVGDAGGNLHFLTFPEGRLLTTVKAHPNPNGIVPVLSLSPDGRTLVSAGGDGRFRRWMTDGTAVDTLPLPLPTEPDDQFGFVRHLDFTPDGQRLIAGCETGKIVVWDLDAGEAAAEMTEPKVSGTDDSRMAGVYAVDHDRFVTFCRNSHYRIWDLSKRSADGNPEYLDFQTDSSSPKREIRSAAISPSRKRILVSDNRHRLSLLNTQNGEAAAFSEGLCKSRYPVFTLSDAVYHPGGDRILAGTYACRPLLAYDPATMRVTTEYVPSPDLTREEHTDMKGLVHSIAVPETGTEFAVALGSGEIQFYDIADPVPRKRLAGFFPASGADRVIRLAASPAGKRLAGTSADTDEIIVWNWGEAEEFRRWKKRNRESLSSAEEASDRATFALIFSGEDRLMEITLGGRLVQWNTETGEAVYEKILRPYHGNILGGFRPVVTCGSVSHDRESAALGFSDGTLMTVGISDGEIRQTNNTLAFPLSNIDTQRGRSDFTAAPPDGTALNLEKAVTGIDWSPGDQFLAVAFSSGKMVLTEPRYFSVLAAAAAGKRNADSAEGLFIKTFFTRGGKLVTAGSDAVLRRWDFQRSSEQETVLKTGYGADRLDAARMPNAWAGIREEPFVGDKKFYCKKVFFYYEGGREIFRRDNVTDFQRWSGDSFGESFLLLGEGGLSLVNSRGESVREPSLLPQAGDPELIRIRLSPNRRHLAGIGWDGAVYLRDLQQTKDRWQRLVSTEGDGSPVSPRLFTHLAFRPDSLELAAVTNEGRLHFFSMEKGSPFRGGPVGPMTALNQGEIAYTRSGRFLIQTGASGTAAVWDVKNRKLFQNIEIGLFERVGRENLSVSGLIPLDRGFGAGESDDAFVLSGTDGVLRFYQYQKKENEFRPVYIISPLTLGNLQPAGQDALFSVSDLEIVRRTVLGHLRRLLDRISSPDFALENDPELKRNILGDEFAGRSDLGKDTVRRIVQECVRTLSAPAETKTPDGIAAEGENGGAIPKNIMDMVPEVYDMIPDIIRHDRLWTDALALSDDGRTLFVGTSGEVRSYNMETVRQNIAGLEDRWKSGPLSSLTGLHYLPNRGFSMIRRNYLVTPVSHPEPK